LGAAVVNQGIRLNANGGALQLDLNATWKGAVYSVIVKKDAVETPDL